MCIFLEKVLLFSLLQWWSWLNCMSMLFGHHTWDDYIHKPDVLWDWCITIKLYPFLCCANGCYYFFFCYDCWLIQLLSDLATTCEDTSLTTRIHRFRATLNTGVGHSSHSATWSTLQIRNCICLGPDIRTIDYVIVTFNRLLSKSIRGIILLFWTSRGIEDKIVHNLSWYCGQTSTTYQ